MSYKYNFKLTELDCANCAKRIENALNNDENIIKANVNFVKLKLTVETTLNSGVKDYVSNIVKSVDSSVSVLEENDNLKSNLKFDICRLILGIILFILSMVIHYNVIHEILLILAYLILLYRVLKKAILMLIKSFTFDENMLISISCIGAYFTDNIHEGLMVIILYEIGKILESIAVNNSRRSISDLMNIKPEYANLKKGKTIEKVSPYNIQVGDVIVVKQGEKIPLDGEVIQGSAKLDKSILTGESLKEEVKKGSPVLSGSINVEGLLTIKVTKTYENSTVANILALVENATDKKAKTENFVSAAAKIYTPIILILAIMISILLPLLFHVPFNEALYRALVFLVVSCPCAIAISVPLSYFSGIGAASKRGILIKGSNYLEAISSIKEIVFDKTGTITEGSSENYKLEIFNDKYNEDDIIKYYVSGEVLSNHPIAKNIINIFKDYKPVKVSNFEEVSGKGITFKMKSHKIKIGSSSFCGKGNNAGIYLNIDDEVIAKLLINDGIKEDASKIIAELKKSGINCKMFTGDNKDIALDIASKVGISDVSYELLPQDKFKLLEEELEKYNKQVAFVGDGVNDAPVLRLATVGISMGAIGSEAAIEASDVVIMNDALSSILGLIKISKKTSKIIKENLIFAIGIKLLILILSSFGLASMWMAVFADTGVTLLTIINTTRILKR